MNSLSLYRKTAPVAGVFLADSPQPPAVSSFGCRELFLVGRRGGEVIKLQPFWVTVGQLFTLGEAVEDRAAPLLTLASTQWSSALSLQQEFVPWALPNTS